jgi:hypothetical protein
MAQNLGARQVGQWTLLEKPSKHSVY